MEEKAMSHGKTSLPPGMHKALTSAALGQIPVSTLDSIDPECAKLMIGKPELIKGILENAFTPLATFPAIFPIEASDLDLTYLEKMDIDPEIKKYLESPLTFQKADIIPVSFATKLNTDQIRFWFKFNNLEPIGIHKVVAFTAKYLSIIKLSSPIITLLEEPVGIKLGQPLSLRPYVTAGGLRWDESTCFLCEQTPTNNQGK